MKFSENWLREWVNPAVTTDELVAQVTLAGLEVDDVETAAGVFTGVVVGEILTAEPHPNADKLQVCTVSDGTEQFQVVCGAPNARPGIKIPFAKIGAVLGGDFKIKKAKLRQVESFGMLCSASELEISDENDGILELAADAPVGADIREYLNLNDSIIDVDLTPNRADCLSIAGLAREVGVINKVDVTPVAIEMQAVSIDDSFPIRVDATEGCPRYLGRVIKGVNVKAESPLWMVEKLRRSGIRSIDPIVDITNYVMIELGQPMHAFDLSNLTGSIVVRLAEEGEKILLLDGQEVALRSDTMVIADEQKALAIAGVMGGYLLLFPKAKVDVLFIIVIFFRIFPIPAWIVLGVWFALQVFNGAVTPTDGGGVAYWAHAGGFVAGLVMILPTWLRRGAVRFWNRTHGHPPHPEAEYKLSRSSIPRIPRR